jgi:hypothetical protein
MGWQRPHPRAGQAVTWSEPIASCPREPAVELSVRQLKAFQARDIHLTEVPSQEVRERIYVLRSTVTLLPRAVVYA